MDRKIVLPLFLLFSDLVLASPEGLINGSAALRHMPENLTEIQVLDERAILNWHRFSIDAGEIVRFLQNNSDSAVLNRVLGDVPSSILGRLEANGHVYLLNPSGILIGKDAVIQTANFVATTFDIDDAAFLGGQALELSGASKAAVINLGTIETSTGDIALIAYRVDNQGQLTAPQGNVSLIAGTSVLLQPQDRHRVTIRPSNEALQAKEGISQEGVISAVQAELKADGSIYELAIRDEGTIEATQFQERNGKILLVADQGRVEVRGTLRTESGNVEIDGSQIGLLGAASIDTSGENQGGDVRIGIQASNILFEKTASINASALGSGNAGKVTLISKNGLGSFGTIIARGGNAGGNGGFVELSAPHFDFFGTIDRYAPQGNSGLLYIDPCDINITNAGVTDGTFPGGIYSPTMATNNINQTDIDTALMTGPVVIDTAAGAGGPFGGRLVVVNDFLYARANDLTLIADETLQVQALLENSGTGSINLQGIQGIAIGNLAAPASVVTTSGNVTIGNFRVVPAAIADLSIIGGNVAGASSEIRTDSGNISITVDQATVKGGLGPGTHALITRTSAAAGTIDFTATVGNIAVDGNTAVDAFAEIGGGSGTLNTDITVTCQAGGLQLSGNSTTGSYAHIGLGSLTPASGTLIGDINVSAAQGTSLSSGLGTDAFTQIGHRGGDTATVVNINGNVQVSMGGDLFMQAGGDRSYALIGHGTDTYGVGDNWTGDVDVTAGGTFSLNGGGGNPSNAVIGFLALSTAVASTGPINVSSNVVSVTAQGGAVSTITSGTGMQSQTFIGAFIAEGAGNLINVNSLQVTTAGDLNITASSAASQALAGIVMACAAGNTSTSNLLVNIGGDLTLNGGTTGLNATIVNVDPSFPGPFTFTSTINARSLTLNANGSGALIYSGGTLAVNTTQSIRVNSSATDLAAIAAQTGINIFAGGDIILDNNGAFAGIAEVLSGPVLIQAQGNIGLLSGARISHTGSSGDMDIIAGQSLFIGNNSNINYVPKLGNLNLVVDNLFPTAPQIGPGMFLVNTLGTVTTAGGFVRIFTAAQGQNTILGTINGASFNAGPIFADVPPEKWGVYYFDPFFYAGQSFTIFYKETVFTSIVTPLVIQTSVSLAAEELRDIHPYDEHLGWPLHYTMKFAEGYFPSAPNSVTYFLRKKQRDESQPKENPVVVYDDQDRL